MVIDASALVSIALEEPTEKWVRTQLQAAENLRASTVSVAEALIKIRARDPDHVAKREALLLALPVRFVPPDLDQARQAADARTKYPLNFGDCFVYALAKLEGGPILTLDADFRGIPDVRVILPPPPPRPA